MKQVFKIYGMTCIMCAKRIEKNVRNCEGIKNVFVDLASNTMTVELDHSSTKIIESICDTVKNLGFGIDFNQEKKLENKFWGIELVLSIFLLMPIIYFSFFYEVQSFSQKIIQGSVEILLSILIFGLYRNYLISGFKNLVSLTPNMFSLVFLGTFASFFLSLINLFLSFYFNDARNLYFDSSVMILVFVSIGKKLELVGKDNIANAILDLMDKQPKVALKLTNGIEEQVLVSQLVKDDIILVKPGEKVSVDGHIIDGNSSLDESLITGESYPKDKSIGDDVFAGALNQFGTIKIKVSNTIFESKLTKIFELVQQASLTKAKLTKIIDTVCNYFVPTIIFLSILTFIVWVSITGEFLSSAVFAITVLVVSCPCALGLATPLSIVVALGLGARRGILFKSSSAIESFSQVKSIVFDKTGTLTTGNFVVTCIEPLGINEEDFLSILGSLEKNSEHPIAKSIVKYTNDRKISYIESESFTYYVGSGISGNVKGEKYFAGNRDFISKNCSETIFSTNTSKTVDIYLATHNKLLGCIKFTDQIFPSSENVVKFLKKNNIKLNLISGDSKIVANSIGSKLGFIESEIYSEMLPNDKLDKIEDLLKIGSVAMVGDGLNDSPSMKKATVGIAMGGGADLSIDAADIVLLNNNPKDLIVSYKISRATVKNIYQNIFWGFIYNIICIPIAAGCFHSFGIIFTPSFAALSMSFSSAFVVFNSLRLKFKKFDD